MAKPGPAKGSIRLTEEHRDKIRKSKILQRLIDHAEGKEGVDMNQTQVTAALGLLKKALPDLQSIDMNASVEHDVTDPIKSMMDEIAAKGVRLVGRD